MRSERVLKSFPIGQQFLNLHKKEFVGGCDILREMAETGKS